MGEVELKLITKKEKARELKVSIRTIDRWVLQDKIKYTYLPNSKRKWFFKE